MAQVHTTSLLQVSCARKAETAAPAGATCRVGHAQPRSSGRSISLNLPSCQHAPIGQVQERAMAQEGAGSVASHLKP